MSFFNKDKKPTLKKTATKNDKEKAKLSKYLPTTLFIGIQEDVNEKALISYITSLSQSAFNNVREAKYSIHRLAKNKYLYEIHNGSETLTYLPLVISTVIEGGKSEVILKTNSQNVRVLKKTSTKIETNTLIESNNREDDAVVDYEAKGKLKHLIKKGTEVFVVSSISFAITGVLAGVSFVTKYYMLNEDYSFNPELDIQMTAHDYLSTTTSEHSQTKYIDSIEFVKGKWKTNYKEIEAPKAIVSIIKEDQPQVKHPVDTDATRVMHPADAVDADAANARVMHPADVVDAGSYNPFEEEQQEPMEMNSLMEKAKMLREKSISTSTANDSKPSISEASLEKPSEIITPEIKEEVAVPDVQTNIVKEEIILPDVQAKIVEEENAAPVVEDDFSIPVIDSVEKTVDVKTPVDEVIEEVKVEKEPVDEFEIVDAADIKSLDLSNLPADIILE